MNDTDLAEHLADTAGQLLLTLQQSGLFGEKALGKAGDRVANESVGVCMGRSLFECWE